MSKGRPRRPKPEIELSVVELQFTNGLVYRFQKNFDREWDVYEMENNVGGRISGPITIEAFLDALYELRKGK